MINQIKLQKKPSDVLRQNYKLEMVEPLFDGGNLTTRFLDTGFH